MAKTKKKKVQSIVVYGKRWFQKTYGNTYHTATIHVDGELVATIPYSYGYGSMYIQNAAYKLEELGFMPGRKHYPVSNIREDLRHYCERNKIQLIDEVVDVARKKDL